jgi:hypothetical protein
VVKVPPSLVKEDPQAENGLIRTRLVEEIGVTDGLIVTGEVQLNENAAVHISPRIPGIIESVKVDMGAHVRPFPGRMSIGRSPCSSAGFPPSRR